MIAPDSLHPYRSALKEEPTSVALTRDGPDSKVIVLVVDERGQAAVGIQLEVRRLLMLHALCIQVFALVLKSKKDEQVCHFPVPCEQPVLVSDKGMNSG